MTLSHLLLLGVLSVCAVAAVQLARRPLAQSWDQFLSLAAVLAASGIAWRVLPELAGLVAVVAWALLVVAPGLAHHAAWRAVARGDLEGAHRAARVIRWLHPIGDLRRLDALLDLAGRAQGGEAFDLEASLDLAGPEDPRARASLAVVLQSWRGAFDEVAARLDDPALRDAMIAQGEMALVLAAYGEARGPDAMCDVWSACRAGDPTPASTASAAGALLILAAHLGEVTSAGALLDELAGEVPPSRAAYWRAVALQRAGRADEARAVIDDALARGDALPALRARLLRRRESPFAPAVASTTAAAMEARATLQERVRARAALADLTLRAQGQTPRWTFALGAALVLAYGGSAALGAPGERALVALGALTIPLRGAGDAWRLIAYAFLHAGALHLAVNVLTLGFFGRFVERRMGAARMLGTYALGAVAGGVCAAASAEPGSLVVGASGAIFALVGASVAHIARDRALRSTPEGRGELALLGALLAVQAANDLLSLHVSGGAHAGGFAVGAVVGALRTRRVPRDLRSRARVG